MKGLSKKIKVICVSILFGLSLHASTEIYPVTPGVIESINEIKQLSKSTENQLSTVTKKLTRQLETFKQTGCSGSGKYEESNCMDQFKQIKSSFVELLDGLDSQLPSIQTKVQQAVKGMEKNVRNFGQKRSLKDLEKMFNENGQAKKRRVNRQGLSKFLDNITSSLSIMKSNSRFQTGLEVYADFKGIDEQINDLRGLISYHKANMAFPDEYLYNNSEEFGEVLGSTMTILYGDTNDLTMDDNIDDVDIEQTKAWYD